MIYYESKKDVKRQVYVDTLNNAFNGSLLTRRNIFTISHQRKRMGSEINTSIFLFYFFLLFHLTLGHLISSGFDSQKIILKLVFCFVLMKF